MEGKVISSDNPKAKIGKTIIKNVQYKNGAWTGKMFAPKKQKWYDASFERKQDKLEITVAAGFFSKTIEWKRTL